MSNVFFVETGGAPTTVHQATGGLSYLRTTPDRGAGISCLSRSGKIQYKHTATLTHVHLSMHICFHTTLLGLYVPGPPWTGGPRVLKSDGCHPGCSLSAEPSKQIKKNIKGVNSYVSTAGNIFISLYCSWWNPCLGGTVWKDLGLMVSQSYHKSPKKKCSKRQMNLSIHHLSWDDTRCKMMCVF